MKKTYSYAAATALLGAFMVAAPLISNAQEDNNGGDGQAPGAPAVMRDRVERNRDIRNELRREGSSTMPRMLAGATTTGMMPRDDERGMVREDRREAIVPAVFGRMSTSTRLIIMAKLAASASSTEFEGHEGWKQARVDSFVVLQTRLVNEGANALNNLKSLRDKIASRISTAEQNGKDMTEAKADLTAADAKIAAAQAAVDAVSSYVPSNVSSTGVSASVNVSLEKPRALGKAAIEAVNEARKSLNQVVMDIAHSMGLKIGQQATTTSQQ